MPHAAEILDGLSAIASQATGVAVAWHLLIGAALLALVSGWRPSQRTARLLVGMPLASVAAVAIVFANPFNGLVFTASAVAMTALAMRGDRRPVYLASTWTCATGVALLAFGWAYPHFLDRPAIHYLYAAPVGLVPCPTLAVASGFALLGNGLGARAWTLTLAAVALFYGLFGVFRLGVFLDIPLVIGAIALVVAELRAKRVRTLSIARPATRSGRLTPTEHQAHPQRSSASLGVMRGLTGSASQAHCSR